MTRAGELTAESSLRGSRLLAAAQASLRAADVSQAQALLRWAAPDVTTPLDKAQAEWLQGAIYAELGSMGEAAAVIASSARALQSIDGALAKLAWLESFDAAFSAFLLTKGLTLEHIAEAVLDTPLTPLDQAPPGELLLRGLATRIAVGSAQAAPTFQRLFELVISSDDFLNTLVSPVLYSVAISEMWDWDRGKDLFLKIANYERTRGGLVALRHSLHSLFNQEVWTGRFSVAEEYWNEALDISAAVGGDFLGEYMNFELKAFQGDDEAAEAAMAIVRPLAESVGYGVILGMCATAKCILGLARGRYEEAVEHASVLFDHDLPGLGTRILPELIEAASRCGQIDLAAAALTRLEERARSSGTSWALTALARSQALLASDEDADSFYEQAIRHGEDADRPLDVARARLLRGEWLRRRKQRVSAREELRLAYEALSSMGAKGFAERAATELRATGGRARKRTPETANNLTAQEMQVARLAATGAVNREIAGELFISETTVAYHLRKVFKKLAVTSRRQLATALAEAAGRTN
jgi:DNA-binding NarL/FixJ family response regulator